MTENQTLRNLLRSLASFIGDGAGGILPKLGWELTDFNNYINKSETDTAWEGYQKRKKSHPTETGPSTLPLPQGQKRSSEDEASGSRAKKLRSEDKEADRVQNGFPMLGPMGPSSTSNNLYSAGSRAPERNGIFTELMRGTTSGNSPMFIQPSPTTVASPQYSVSSSNLEGYQPSYMPSVNLNVDPSLSANHFDSPTQTVGGAVQQRLQQPTNQMTGDELEDDDDPNKNEAYKLLKFVPVSILDVLRLTPEPDIILIITRGIHHIVCQHPSDQVSYRGW